MKKILALAFLALIFVGNSVASECDSIQVPNKLYLCKAFERRIYENSARLEQKQTQLYELVNKDIQKDQPLLDAIYSNKLTPENLKTISDLIAKRPNTYADTLTLEIHIQQDTEAIRQLLSENITVSKP